MTSIFPDVSHSADRRAADAVHQLGTQLLAMLSTARILIAAGREVDLSGTEHRIGEFCARAVDLSPALGHEVQATLLAVRAELERTIAILEPRTPA